MPPLPRAGPAANTDWRASLVHTQPLRVDQGQPSRWRAWQLNSAREIPQKTIHGCQFDQRRPSEPRTEA